MQLSAISLALTRAGVVSFSPMALFSNGEQGVFYDIADYTTLFEDSAGTTPITSPLEKPVGLMLDKSKGLVVGSPIATYDFSSSAGWGVLAGSAITGGELVFSSAVNQRGVYRADALFSVAQYYEITFTINSISSGAISVSIGQSNGDTQPKSTAGTHTVRLYGNGSDNYLRIYSVGASTTATVDNVIIKVISGNHAYQSTTTSRPTLSARYNLLTKTDSLGPAGGWATYTGAWTGTYTTAPNGTNTAMSIKSVTDQYYYLLTIGVAATYRLSVWAKPNTGSSISLFEWYTNQTKRVVFSLVGSGSVTANANGYNAGISLHPKEAGWYYCFVDFPITAGSKEFNCVPTVSNTEVFMWGADLRPANDGVGLPAYQRVNTATDYDYAGFPPYLKFDGTDDSMATGSIDFTGTDKMFVAAGVRKLSDAAQAVVAELSVNRSANTGAFTLTAPNSPGDNFSWQARGSVDPAALVATPYSAPVTAVVSATSDISTDSRVLRVNNAEFTVTADQGAGNFLAYPLYIGRRGGTTLPFNGRLYSLVVCGKLASAAEIAATEAWVNGKTKAF